jgi:putative transposase
LRQAESGTPVADVCCQIGIAEATFYVWKKKYANLGVLELRELRQLRDENARLKRVVAELTLDRHILQEVVKKRSEAVATTRDCALDSRTIPAEQEALVPACAAAPFHLVLQEHSPGSLRAEGAYSRTGA